MLRTGMIIIRKQKKRKWLNPSLNQGLIFYNIFRIQNLTIKLYLMSSYEVVESKNFAFNSGVGIMQDSFLPNHL